MTAVYIALNSLFNNTCTYSSQDVIAMAIFALFFFCGGTAVAVFKLADRDWKELIDLYRTNNIRPYVEVASQAQKVYTASIFASVRT